MTKVQSLLVRVNTSENSDFKHMVGKFVWVDSDKLSSNYGCQFGGIDHADSWGETLWAKDLEANSQADRGESRYYGMELLYRPYSVTLRDCELMVKTLRSIESKLEKFAALHDYAKDVTEYMFRLALVTKCKYIILEEPNFSWKFKAYSVDNYGKRAIEKLREGKTD